MNYLNDHGTTFTFLNVGGVSRKGPTSTTVDEQAVADKILRESLAAKGERRFKRTVPNSATANGEAPAAPTGDQSVDPNNPVNSDDAPAVDNSRSMRQSLADDLAFRKKFSLDVKSIKLLSTDPATLRSKSPKNKLYAAASYSKFLTTATQMTKSRGRQKSPHKKNFEHKEEDAKQEKSEDDEPTRVLAPDYTPSPHHYGSPDWHLKHDFTLTPDYYMKIAPQQRALKQQQKQKKEEHETEDHTEKKTLKKSASKVKPVGQGKTVGFTSNRQKQTNSAQTKTPAVPRKDSALNLALVSAITGVASSSTPAIDRYTSSNFPSRFTSGNMLGETKSAADSQGNITSPAMPMPRLPDVSLLKTALKYIPEGRKTTDDSLLCEDRVHMTWAPLLLGQTMTNYMYALCLYVCYSSP